MLPNLVVLEKKCASLGLTVSPKGKKLAKQDCVDVLRQHFLPAGGLPYQEMAPMLCFAEWNLKESEQKDMWEGPDWVAQVKMNGCRLVIHFVKDVGVFAHSRTVSVKTYRYEEATDQLLISSFKPAFSATVDAEVMIEKPVDTRPYTAKGQITKSSLHSTTAVMALKPENSRKLQVEQDAPLQFHIFDVMRWEGQDLRGLKLAARETHRAHFEDLIAKTEIGKNFHFPPLVKANRRAFYEGILAAGGEGVIMKNLKSTYEDSSSRLRTHWVKVKKRIEFDAFVIGFERGDAGKGWENLIGDLHFGIHTEKGIHMLAKCSNMTMETRQKISIYDPATNTVSMDPNMYQKVAEISGQDVSSREYRLSHATIDRWRPKQGPDAKNADQCQVKMADLITAAEWVG